MNLRTSKTRSSSCQCTTTLKGEQKETKKDVNTIQRQFRNMILHSLAVIGLSWSLDQNNWYGTCTEKLDRSWETIAEDMVANFSDSGHPIFRASSALERGELRSKGGRKKFLYISTVFMRTSSCFFVRSFLQLR